MGEVEFCFVIIVVEYELTSCISIANLLFRNTMPCSRNMFDAL